MIIIFDNGTGNIASISNMFRYIGCETSISSSKDAVLNARGIIFPGVGAFDYAMQKLNDAGATELIRHAVIEKKIPFLGVCLGMQLLFDKSEEGHMPGLGLIPGVVRKFDFSLTEHDHLKIPHMGWNSIEFQKDNPLFQGFDASPRFYFVHSYHAVCRKNEHIAAVCQYGQPFTCAVTNNNIYGVQFHPEKSHKFGMRLFQNFLELIC